MTFNLDDMSLSKVLPGVENQCMHALTLRALPTIIKVRVTAWL